VGCVVSFLGAILAFNAMGFVGILLAGAGVPFWAEQAGVITIGVAPALLMLAGWALARRRNPYGARVLLWGFALTLVALSVLTAVFNFVDRLNGIP
jgi:hypothetical protein